MILLGIDLGTSSLKLVALDDHGTLRGSARQAYPILGSLPGQAEQAAEDWIGALVQATSQLATQGLDLSRVAGIGLSAQMPTFIPVDATGVPLAQAMLWCDARADAAGAALLARWGRERHYAETGVVLDGRYIAPMCLWSRDQGRHGSDCQWLLSAKDYLHLWLTGQACTDPSTASGFGVYSLASGRWDPALCLEAGLDPRCLPAIVPSGTAGGALSGRAASLLGLAAGLPVACGAADSVAAVLGMGVNHPGEVCQMAGSSTALIAVAGAKGVDPQRRYLVTPLAEPGTWGFEADILASGTSLEWLANLGLPPGDRGARPLARRLGELSALAARVEPGAEGLFFFPYMAGGEQSVLWDADLCGGMSGLSLRHGIPHMARALYEGLCFETRRCLEAFAESGQALGSITCAGPASQDRLYMRLLADITALPCRPSSVQDASALGAAILAGIGCGAWNWTDAPRVARPSPEEACILPDRVACATYDALYADYRARAVHARRSGTPGA